jgi:hypothetical protein
VRVRLCVDGVCCDSACDQQCAGCNIGTRAGYCTSQILGDDLSAAAPCTGAKTCSFDISSPTIASCRLKAMQACSSNAECATGNCETFYVDRDGDGFGGSATLQLCAPVGAAAPTGYVTASGDCCDSDPSANPGQTNWFTTEDACGSWDFNCDEKVEVQNASSASSCGQPLRFGALSSGVTVACH